MDSRPVECCCDQWLLSHFTGRPSINWALELINHKVLQLSIQRTLKELETKMECVKWAQPLKAMLYCMPTKRQSFGIWIVELFLILFNINTPILCMNVTSKIPKNLESVNNVNTPERNCVFTTGWWRRALWLAESRSKTWFNYDDLLVSEYKSGKDTVWVTARGMSCSLSGFEFHHSVFFQLRPGLFS